MPSTHSDIIGRTLGNTERDVNGNIKFNKEEADSLPVAVYKGWTNAALEVLTERMGDAIGGFATKIPKGQIVKAISGKAGQTVAKQIGNFSKAVGWHGAPIEFLEEWINVPLNAIFVGDSEFSDMFDTDQQLTTFLTVVAMGSSMGTLQTTAGGLSKIKSRKDYNSSVKLFNEYLTAGDKANINNVLDNNNLTIQQQSALLHKTISNIKDKEAQGAALTYVVNRYKGESSADPALSREIQKDVELSGCYYQARY